jgi:hypothetical protein
MTVVPLSVKDAEGMMRICKFERYRDHKRNQNAQGQLCD